MKANEEKVRKCITGYHLMWEILRLLPPYCIRDEENKIEIVLLDDYFFATETSRQEKVLSEIKSRLEDEFKTAMVSIKFQHDETILITITV